MLRLRAVRNCLISPIEMMERSIYVCIKDFHLKTNIQKFGELCVVLKS